MLIGNPEEVQTPKGLFATKATGLHLSYFIGNYKGGRNESFMYGTDEQTIWYDYDLISAYTTAMADLGLPAYQLGELVSEEDFYELIGSSLDQKDVKPTKLKNLLEDYYIINATFTFPKKVKYPSIPCYIDETTTIYPLSGSCLLTGPEYILAISQGCEIRIKSIFSIPSAYNSEKNNRNNQDDVKTVVYRESDLEQEQEQEQEIKVIIKPFHAIINEIQKSRREYPKGTINNLLYKEMGNSIYGNVVRGMSNKKSFDSLTGQYIKMTATELSNPILAS
jgi:hypothetical protein